MKKLVNVIITIILIGIVFSSCSKVDDAIITQSSNEEAPNGSFKSFGVLHQAAVNYMIENGLSQVAYFQDTTPQGYTKSTAHEPSGPQGFVLSEGEFPLLTATGGFAALGGSGDFIKFNPDGTATLQINSNNAQAFYSDLQAFPPMMYEGFGHMHMHHTGSYTIIPQPDGTFLYMVEPNGYGAVTWNGNSKVNLLPTTSPDYQLRADYLVSGNGQVIKNSLKLK